MPTNVASSPWPTVGLVVFIALAVAASFHALLYKRDARAAVAWVGFIWLVPFLGALLYVLLGVNRIRRRARSLRVARPRTPAPLSARALEPCPHPIRAE